ncbi:tetratricopeptide repeat protein 1 [Bombina bombina]|uniref:tetratricopeptide repeat protein 1 n=1 Tax=Bombina bombina TaxID=8345 RepID=UPI00235AA086|nr:tetratricopeptide repeat protein 1 [Bombina bombina]
MEDPEVKEAETGDEEEEQRFHDCAESPYGPTRDKNSNGKSEAPVEGEAATNEATEGLESEGDLETAALDGAADSDSELATGTAEDEVELEEDVLMEMEKEQSEEERQRRREQSTCLKEEGNNLFKKGDYADAEASYTQAILICPAAFQKDRSILFSNRAAARIKQDKNDLALKDCSKAIDLNPDYIRALLRRAELYEKTDKLDEALADYKSVLEKDMSVSQAREACLRLPKQIEIRNEKLKEEMISKLKDLGNLVLRPFGLSTENFQVKQDETSGSYSVNFVQNPNNNR